MADKTTPALERAAASAAQRPATPAKRLRPRDAATLVILDRNGPELRILMGKRRLDLAFMPGKYVFPGGRVDPGDKSIARADDLPQIEIDRLLVNMKGTPSIARARALASAAVREAFEEAGLVIGQRGVATSAVAANWSAFVATGHLPAIGALRFFARAITPPGRPRRFDTRFFWIDATAITERLKFNDGELSGLDWLTLDQARGLDLPNITRVVLEDLKAMLSRDAAIDAPLPFYNFRHGSFRRDLIDPARAVLPDPDFVPGDPKLD